MPKKRHSPEQIIGKLRDADAILAAGKTIGQVCQSLEVSEQTFHRWRAQYGGMKAEEAKRLKHLEEENKRLKAEVMERFSFSGLVGKSKQMREVYDLIGKVAASTANG